MKYSSYFISLFSIASVKTGNAFLSTTKGPSLVPRNTLVNSDVYNNGVLKPTVSGSNVLHTSMGRANTALQMNLVDRLVRVTKANVNKVLMSLESPEKIINQAIVDMQDDLLKIRRNYAEIMATQRRLLKEKEAADAVAQNWYDRAQLALRNGNEELAKHALTKREQQLNAAKNMQSQIDIQSVAIDKLYQSMQVLEGKILEAKEKKDQFIARAKTAESTQKVNDMLSGITGKTSMDAFKRMEEKVEALEAAAEISAETVSLPGAYLPGTVEKDLETEFLLLEASAAVDDELKKMKENLLMGSTHTSTDIDKLNEREMDRISIRSS